MDECLRGREDDSVSALLSVQNMQFNSMHHSLKASVSMTTIYLKARLVLFNHTCGPLS